jgi:mannose-6-phosphate isomerase-like protein (cupin superfamily)
MNRIPRKERSGLLPTTPPPQGLSAGEGPAFWFLDALTSVKATTESTGGAYSLCHQVSPPGSATPYHLHRAEDEVFYVLEGEATFVCDGGKTIAGPGTYPFLPRGIPHGIRANGPGPTKMPIPAMPGTGFVGMMEKMAVPAPERVVAPPRPMDGEN